jgi:hypothetical protein
VRAAALAIYWWQGRAGRRGSVKAELVIRQADLHGVSGLERAFEQQDRQPVAEVSLQDPP